MSKVVYLLGAGASYGKRSDAPAELGASRIKEGLPVVNENISIQPLQRKELVGKTHHRSPK